MKRNICLVINKNNIIRSFALLNSIQRYDNPNLKVWAVCADELSRILVKKMKYSNLAVIALHIVEAKYSGMDLLRSQNSLQNYYSMCIPFVLSFLLSEYKLPNLSFFVPDVYFFSPLDDVFNTFDSDVNHFLVQAGEFIGLHIDNYESIDDIVDLLQSVTDVADLGFEPLDVLPALFCFKDLLFISPYIILPSRTESFELSDEMRDTKYKQYIDELYNCLGSVRSYLPDFTEGLNSEISISDKHSFFVHKAIFNELDEKNIPMRITEISNNYRLYSPINKSDDPIISPSNAEETRNSNLQNVEDEILSMAKELSESMSDSKLDFEENTTYSSTSMESYITQDSTAIFSDIIASEDEISIPVISIIMPTQGTRPELMKIAIESVLNQMFEDFELIIVSDGGAEISDYIRSFDDTRIKYYFNPEHRGCAFARNFALSKAQGKYIAYLDDDDKYYSEHLEILYNYLENTEFKIAYTDSYRVEQVIDEGQYLIARKNVIYSEEFDYEKIHIGNFIPILNIMHKKSCTDNLGGFDEQLNTHEDWELWLRLSREYKFSHIKLITAEYTWRNDNSSTTSANRKDFIDSKKYVYEKYKHITSNNPRIRQLQALDIASLENELNKIQSGELIQFFPEVAPVIHQTDKELKASIIIPVRNGLEYTRQCLDSIFEVGSKYKFEIIVVDNNSEDGSREYLNELQKSDKIKLVENLNSASYSKSNNQGAEIADGKYLIFLNNDTKVCDNWLDNLVEKFKSDDAIGIQGGKLLFDDHYVQHSGIVYGYLKPDLLTHYHVYLSAPVNSQRVNKEREFQFVTGALLAIRREVFREIKGFDENYYFGYEDLDLCLKLRKVGFKVLYNPKVVAYHFESKTKELVGLENFKRHYLKPDGIDQINREYFLSKWEHYVKADDNKYYAEDRMHGLFDDSSERNKYVVRVMNLLNEINSLITDFKQEKAKEIIRILFDEDIDIVKINRFRQFNIPMTNIENAERELGIKFSDESGNTEVYPAPEAEQAADYQIVNERDRILFVMYGWNESGGGTTLPKSIALELAQTGYNIAVFYASLRKDDTKPAYSLDISSDEGVRLYGLYNRPAYFTDPDNPEREINDPNINAQFEKVLDEFKPDVIHFHNFHGLTMSIAKIAHDRGIPSCFTPHNYYIIDPNLYMFDQQLKLWNGVDMLENSFSVKANPDKLELYKQRIATALDMINNQIDITLSVSNRQKQLFTEFGFLPGRMPVVHQANRIVDELQNIEQLIEASTRNLDEPLKFGFIGGVMPQKGVHILALVAQYFPPEKAEFHIFGFVSEYYKEILDKIDVNKRLIYHGTYNYNDLAEIGTKIDMALVPSIWEDCAPLVVLELTAMRLPVIGAKIGGIPDFVLENITGFLYKYDSVEELIRTIDDCVRNKERVEKMRANMPQLHSFHKYFERLQTIYKSLKDRDMRDPLSFEIKYEDFTKLNHDSISQIEPVQGNLTDVVNPPLSESILDGSDEDFIRDYFEDKEFKVLDYSIIDEPENSYFDLNLSVRIFKSKIKSDDIPLEHDENIEYMTELLESETSRADIDHKLEVSESYDPELNIIWEGTQFVYHSLALINREICAHIIDSEVAELTIVPYEDDKFFDPEIEKYAKLAAHDIRFKDKELPESIKTLPYVWIRHQWPPKAEPPKGTKWIIMQPWEFTAHRKDFVDIFNQADEIWTPSNFSRRSFIDSGVEFNKVQVIPNGIDPELFTPFGEKYAIPTTKRFKILFVGGTVYRKGADILLEAFMKLFTAEDDVCLIIKDIGGDSFYKGQTAKNQIEEFKKIPNAPEIHYIDQKLTEWEMAELYRAADIFVSSYRGEGFSLPTLEAMACGIPVMVTEGGSTDDFVDESVGWLIPAAARPIGAILDEKELTHEAYLLEPNLEELMSMLKYVVSDPSQLFKKGINAMLRARCYWTWKNSTMKVYSRLDAMYGTKLAQRSISKLSNIEDDLIIFGRACQEFEAQNFDQALELWNRVILSEQLPQRYKLHIYHNLAMHFILSNEFDKADTMLTIAIKEVFEHPDNSYLRAILLAKQGNYTESYDTLSFIYDSWAYKKTDTTLGIALDNLLNLNGEISYLEGDFNMAIKLFSEALKFNNENADACYGAGLCFISMGAEEEAKDMFEWAIQLKPQFSEAQEELWKLENDSESQSAE